MKKGGKRPGAGKPLGSKNQKTLQWEAIGEALITVHAERFNRILNESDDDKFAKLYLDVMEYFKPKQARVEYKQDGETKININVVRS